MGKNYLKIHATIILNVIQDVVLRIYVLISLNVMITVNIIVNALKQAVVLKATARISKFVKAIKLLGKLVKRMKNVLLAFVKTLNVDSMIIKYPYGYGLL